MSDQVFVLKDGKDHLANTGTAVTTLATMSNLAEGAIAIMGFYSTGVIPVNLAVPATDGVPSKIIIYQEAGGDVPYSSSEFVPGEYEVSVQAHVAGVAPIVVIGSNGISGSMVFGTKAVGSVVGIEITDLRSEVWSHRTTDIAMTITNADMTNTAMLAALVVLLNANDTVSAMLTATSTTDTILTLTGADSEQLFHVRPYGLIYGSTVTEDGTGTSVQVVNEIGDGDSVVEAERRGQMVLGRTSTLTARDQIWTAGTFADSSLSYSAFTISMKHISKHGYGVPPSADSESFITVYYTSTSSAALATALTYLQAMANPSSTNYVSAATNTTAIAANATAIAG